MKQHKRRFKETEFMDDPDFAEALSGGESQQRSSKQQVQQRKAQQFCRQVQRALNLALADRDAGSGMNGLFVEGVSPAPDCGHLLVHVVIPDVGSVADTISALRHDTPRLRSEVALAITRKRAPELSFIPAFAEGGEYD